MSKTKKFKPHYSGEKSHKFWRRVNSFRGENWEDAYAMGVKLQNLEEKVLKFINKEMK